MDVDEKLLATLKISKFEKHVEIVMKNTKGERKRAILFLCEYSPFHPGPETIDELLNQGTSFIPVKYPDNSFQIINLKEILFVKELESIEKIGKINLLIYLENGVQIEASIFEALPEHYGRTLDFFNINKTFLPLLYHSSRLYINKENVIKVEEIT